MRSKSGDEKILDNYEKQGEAIIQQMMQILLRVLRKVDDVAYRRTLEKLGER